VALVRPLGDEVAADTGNIFDSVDPMSGKDVRIKVSELGDVDLGPRRVLEGAVSDGRVWDAVCWGFYSPPKVLKAKTFGKTIRRQERYEDVSRR
jgi:hypothetical protein